jgi:hypothetical protein
MPMDAVAARLIPGIGLVSGLIANYVSLQNRALLAGGRKPHHSRTERGLHPALGVRVAQRADRGTHRSHCQAVEKSCPSRSGGS